MWGSLGKRPSSSWCAWSAAPDGRTAQARIFELAFTGGGGAPGRIVQNVAENSYVRRGDTWQIQRMHVYTILVTDYEMPGQTGLALADDFHAHHGDTPVLLVTAYRTHSLEAQILDRPYLRLVQKPVDYAAIHALIHEIAQAGLGAPVAER